MAAFCLFAKYLYMFIQINIRIRVLPFLFIEANKKVDKARGGHTKGQPRMPPASVPHGVWNLDKLN